MPNILAFTILAVIFAFGQIIAQKTKATLSAAFVIATTLIILFTANILPKDIFTVSAILPIGGVLIGILITAMGNLLDFDELKRQWKTVIISIIGVIIATAIVIIAGSVILGRDLAYAGAPIFAGGSTAALIMTEALKAKGLDSLSLFVVLMLVCQNFIGIPIASNLLKKAGRNFMADEKLYNIYKNSDAENSGVSSRKRLINLPASLNVPSVSLAKIGIITTLSFYIDKLSGGALNYIIVALILGSVFTELGFLEPDILNKTQASGFIMFATLMIVFQNLANTSIQQIISLIVPLIATLGIGVIGAVISGIILGKLLKSDIYLSISMVLTCTFGFPTTMLMSNEVAQALGSNDEETEVLGNYIRPKMVTAGFVTGIFSIAVASVVAGMF